MNAASAQTIILGRCSNNQIGIDKGMLGQECTEKGNPTVAESQSTKQQETSTSKSATVAESPRPDGSNFGKSFGCSGGADQPPTATQAQVPPR